MRLAQSIAFQHMMLAAEEKSSLLDTLLTDDRSFDVIDALKGLPAEQQAVRIDISSPVSADLLELVRYWRSPR